MYNIYTQTTDEQKKNYPPNKNIGNKQKENIKEISGYRWTKKNKNIIRHSKQHMLALKRNRMAPI